MRFPIFSLPGGLAVVCLFSTTHAHTWLEQLRLIASNGSYVGAPGYPRGFVPRDASPGPDQAMVYILPRPGLGAISPQDKMCNPSQTIGSQQPEFPALVAAPQDQIALLYSENGHVTKLEEGRPSGGGFVFIYGTKKPSNDDTYLGIHRVWNTQGTGGDKRGKLLATRHYDDGRCYQVNDASQLSLNRIAAAPLAVRGPDLDCQTDVQLPEDAGTSGSYTLYWVWEWPHMSATGTVAANQTYTGCVDITMTSKKVPDAGPFISKQPYNSMAIEEQLKTQLLVNPTASFTLNTASIFAEQQMPLTTPALNQVPSAAPAPPTASPAAPSSPSSSRPVPHKGPANPGESASNGFITVTVTREQDAAKTVTVTDYVTIGTQLPDAAPTNPSDSSSRGPSKSIATESLVPLKPSDFLPAPRPSTSTSASSSQSAYTSFSEISPPATTTTRTTTAAAQAPTGLPLVRPFLPNPAQSQVSPSGSASASASDSSPKTSSSTSSTSSPSSSSSPAAPSGNLKPSSTHTQACTKTESGGGVYTEPAATNLNASAPVNNKSRPAKYRMRFIRS